MTEANFQISPRRILAIVTWCVIGVGVISWLPDVCHVAAVGVAVACLAMACDQAFFARRRLWAITFIIAMAVQLLGWFVFIACLRTLWYVALYFPVMAIYDYFGLVPHAEFVGLPILVVEVPIVGATVYSLIIAALVFWCGKSPGLKLGVQEH